MPLDIAVLGGGVSVAALVELLASEPSLRGSALRLHARRADRLEVIAAYCRDLVGAEVDVVTTPSLDAALDGVDVVVNLIRFGGNVARGEDEALEWRGVPGDEGLGPGGMANAWRTWPLTRTVAAAIRRRAPESLVLNMAAPLGVTTRALLDAGLWTIGLCELPLVVDRRLAEAGAPELRYVGSNHLGLHLPTSRDREDLVRLGEVARRCGVASEATVQCLGGVPAPYFHRVIRPDLGRSLGIAATPGRARELSSLTEDVLSAMASDETDTVRALLEHRPTPWFRESLVPALVALSTHTPVRLACNVANHASHDTAPLVGWLPEEMVVEVVGAWDPEHFSPQVPDEPGEAATAYLISVAAADTAMCCAAQTHSDTDRMLALRAWEEIDAAGWSGRSRTPAPRIDPADAVQMRERHGRGMRR